MTEVLMQKLAGNLLAPTDENAEVYVRKLKLGQPVRITVKKVRNYQFFKKFWALVNFAFEFWEPPVLPDDPEQKWRKNVTPEKNLDQFRKDLTILAGYYEAYYRINGEVRIEAKSISFARMEEDDFEKLFSATIDVVLKHIMTNLTEDELRDAVDSVLRFS